MPVIENLLFSLNRVMPFFLLIVLGYFLVTRGGVKRGFFAGANSFVYDVALPVSLFCSVAGSGGEGVDLRLAGYCALVTIISFAAIWLVTELVFKDKAVVGTLVQGAFRGNFALLGMPVVEAVGGPEAGRKAAVCILGVVPLYNILSVVALKARGREVGRPDIRGIVKGVVTNRLILGILLGLPFAVLSIKLPFMVQQTLNYIGSTATPLGLLSIGGLFNLADATARLRPALYSTAIKNLLLPLVMLPLSYALGFRGDELLILLILFAAPAAVSSFPMASALGGDAPLASNILIVTTALSAFGYAGGIYLLRSLGWIA